MDGRVADYLAALVVAARDVLGDVLFGTYVTGSVALRAYEPGRSDVDVALVTTRGMGPPEKRTLVERLRDEALPCPARGLELVVYRRDVAAAGGRDAGFELELNTGARMPFRATYQPQDRPAADGDFWYALDRSLLATRGLALAGPPASEVFADLSDVDLVEALVTALRWWLARPAPAGAEDAVLNACRAYVRVRDGIWLAKVDAGRRMRDLGLAPRSLIEQSIAARAGDRRPTRAGPGRSRPTCSPG